MLDNLYDPESPLGKALAAIQGNVAPMTQAVQQLGQVASPQVSAPLTDAASAMAQGLGQGAPGVGGAAAAVANAAAHGGLGGGAAEGLQQMMKILTLPQRGVLALGGATPEGVQQGGGDFAERLGANRHIGEFAAGALTDPLTYTGLGLGEKALAGAGRLGMDAANPFMRGLKVVSEADSAYSHVADEAATKLITGIQSGLVPVNKGLGRIFPDLPKWTELATKTGAMDKAVEWLETRHGLDLRGAQGVWTTSGLDALHEMLPEGIRSQVTKQELGTLMKDATAQNITDFTEARANYATLVKDGLNIKPDGKFLKGYHEFTDWWKRQALGSLGYLGNNLKGGLFMGMLEGVGPQQVLKDIWDNKGAILKGQEFDLSDASRLSSRTSMPTPGVLSTDAAASATADAGSAGLMPKMLDVGIGAALGGTSAELEGDNPLTGILVGAGAGAGLRPLTGKIRQISQGLETAMRQRAYVKGTSDQLVDSLGEIEAMLQNTLLQPRASGSVPNPAFFNTINNVVKSKGGQVSSDEIGQMLQNSARVRPDEVQAFKTALDDTLYRASQGGVDLSHKIHFDYNDLSNIERATKQAFPFATWYMKALPFFAEQAIEKPGVATVPARWMQEAHENRQEKGLTSRVEGQLPNPIGRKLMSAILGRDVGDDYQNPMSNLVPFADASRGLSDVGNSSNPVDAGLDILSAIGLGINPVADLGTRVLGLRGTDAPAQGINLRAAGPIEALTGIDLNAPGRELEAGVRKNLTGKEPTDLNDVSVLKRLDELALRNTGRTITSGDPAVARYVRAKAEQSGPLWDAAQREVGSERGLNAVGGFVDSGLRGTIVSPQEEQIRGAGTKTLVPQQVSLELRDFAQRSPQADAPLQHVSAVLDAVDTILEKTGKDMPPEVAKRLADPTNANIAWVANQIHLHEQSTNPLLGAYSGSGSTEQRQLQNQNAALRTAGQLTDFTNVPQKDVLKVALHTSPANDREMMLTDHPELAAYVAWKKVNPSGNLEQFVAQSKR